MKYQIWLHMDFPKNGCFSDVVMIHNENDSLYVRALNLVDIIQSTYLMNINHEIMEKCDYGFNIKDDETPADYIADLIKFFIDELENCPAEIIRTLSIRNRSDVFNLSITITKQ